MNEVRLNDLFALDPFDQPLHGFMRPWRVASAGSSAPQIRIDVSEDDASYAVKADIPGVRKEDIDVQIDGNQVTISAEVKHDKEEKKGNRVVRSERQYGFASRSFTLASAVDDAKADAKYRDGVLELKLPKRTQGSHKRLTIS